MQIVMQACLDEFTTGTPRVHECKVPTEKPLSIITKNSIK